MLPGGGWLSGHPSAGDASTASDRRQDPKQTLGADYPEDGGLTALRSGVVRPDGDRPNRSG